MARYRPAVGGYQWNQLLADNQQRLREARQIMRQLEGVATTDATKVLLLRAQMLCTDAMLDNERLLGMRGEGNCVA